MAKNTEFNVIIRGKDALSGVLGRANANVKSFAKNIFSVGGALKAVGALGVTVGFGALFKGAIREASEAADQISRLRTAVRNAGGSFDDIRPQIEGTVNSVHALTGAAKGDLRAALQALITQTGDVGGSIEKLNLVADVAAGRQISLTDAAELVGKVMNGNTKIMKELGVATKNPTVAIAELEKRYKGFAESAANPIARTINRIKQAFNDNLEALGNSITGTDAWEKSTNAIIEGLGNLAKWVENNEALIGQLGDALFTVAEIGMTALKPFLDVALVLFYTLIDAIDMAVTGLRELKAAMSLDWDKVAQLDADLQERKAARERGRLGLPSGTPLRRPGTGTARVPRRGAPAPTEAQIEDAEKGNAELRKLIENIHAERKKAIEDFRSDFAQVVAKSTGSAVAGLELAFNELIAKAKELGFVAEAAELTRLRDSATSTQLLLEDSARQLALIEHNAKDAAEEYEGITRLVERAEGKLRDTTLSDEDRKRLNEELLALYEKQAKALGKVTNAAEGAKDATKETKKSAAQTADAITDAARAGLELLNAFGAIDDKTEEVLENILEMGEGIARIASGDVVGGSLQVLGSLAGLLKDTFGHPGQERARAFREQLRLAREEWELMLAPLGDELSGRSPLEQELVDLERQADALRRRAAAEFLPQGERDRRASMSVEELTAEAAAARRRGHHAGAEGLEAYRDALIQIEELFEAKAQQAGRRATEQSAADPGAAVGDSLVTSGLAGLSYVHGDELVSFARLSTGYLHDIRDAVVGGTGAGETTIAGGLTINIGNIDARGSINEVATQQAVTRGIDAALHAIRRNVRAAAGAPRNA